MRTVIISETEKISLPAEAFGKVNSVNNTCDVYCEDIGRVGAYRASLFMLVNGVSGEVYDINDSEQNWIQVDVPCYHVQAPVVVKNGKIDLENVKFSINKITDERSLMDSYDYKHTPQEVLSL